MSKKTRTPLVTPCPCDSGLDYRQCCAPFHDGHPAPTPQALMRSRYSAYTLGLTPYLMDTWAPETCPPDLDAHTAPQPKWLGLEVKEETQTGDTGTVRSSPAARLAGEPFGWKN